LNNERRLDQAFRSLTPMTGSRSPARTAAPRKLQQRRQAAGFGRQATVMLAGRAHWPTETLEGVQCVSALHRGSASVRRAARESGGYQSPLGNYPYRGRLRRTRGLVLLVRSRRRGEADARLHDEHAPLRGRGIRGWGSLPQIRPWNRPPRKRTWASWPLPFVASCCSTRQDARRSPRTTSRLWW